MATSTRGRILAAFIVTAGAVALCPPIRAQAQEVRKPNIVLIYADDLDPDEVGFADDPKAWPSYTGKAKLGIKGGTRKGQGGYADSRMLTPHIDSLARDGAVLTRFYQCLNTPLSFPAAPELFPVKTFGLRGRRRSRVRLA